MSIAPTQTAIPSIERRALRVEEAAMRLSVGRTTLYKLIRQGRLRSIKLAARTVIPCSEIDRLLNEAE